MKSGTDTTKNVSRHLSSHEGKKSPKLPTGGITVVAPAVPPLVLPTMTSSSLSSREKPETHRHSSSRLHPIPEGRPIERLASEVDAFVRNMSKTNVNDKDIVDLERLTTIKSSLMQVAKDYEKRPEFKIRENMSARKVELDNLIAIAEKEYADKQIAHQRAIESIDVKLDVLSRQKARVMGVTLISQFKSMQDIQHYNLKIQDAISSINDAIDAQGCCSRIFCSCWPSAEILKKQKELQQLRAEEEMLASDNDKNVSDVIRILTAKIQADEKELTEQREKLANNQPVETAQKLRDERTQLQADINANREAYYHAISPQVMLNLVRLQSFLGRMQRKIDNAKTAAEAKGDTVKVGLLHALSVIVGAFLAKFNTMCGSYVCRPPQNEDNQISYAQYCDRFHKLKEDEKRLLIKGPPAADDIRYDSSMKKIQELDEGIFHEHMEQMSMASAANDSALSLRL